jgi:polar amino acid transport system substrate-binding protein
MTSRTIRIVVSAVTTLAISGCAPFPRDTGDSTADANQYGLTVGASGDPPFVVVGEDGQVSGSDAAIVERFARANGFRVRWVAGGHDPLMQQLEKGRLHLVIGGHAKRSPWESRVGWSATVPTEATLRQHSGMRRFAVPPGENAWHMLLDNYLVAHEGAR